MSAGYALSCPASIPRNAGGSLPLLTWTHLRLRYLPTLDLQWRSAPEVYCADGVGFDGVLGAAILGLRTTRVSWPRTLIVRAGSEWFGAGPSRRLGREELLRRRQLFSSLESLASDS